MAAGLASRVGLPLLDRLRRSPFGGAFLNGARLGLECGGEGLLLATDRVVPWAGEAVDAALSTTVDDLDRMLAGVAPAGRVGWALGERDGAPRLKQARAALALAALGWCGPWPDPGADAELVALTRRAVLDLAVGPADRIGPLFPAAAPPELHRLQLRFTDGARPRHATVGLSDQPGAPEFVTDAHPRWLRVAALAWLEEGSVPRGLAVEGTVLRFHGAPMPLPNAISTLYTVEMA